MTKLYELVEKDDYLKLPEISRGEIRLLWHSEYWDGVLSGLLLYKETKYWFQIAYDIFSNGEEGNDPRKYVIVALIPDQLNELEYWHELFRQKVGLHTDYDENVKRPVGALKPRELRDEFYELYGKHQPSDFSNNEVTGWFKEY